MNRGTKMNTARYCAVFISLAVLFVFSVIWNINSGSVDISVQEILRIIFRRGAIERGELSVDPSAFNIIWKIRLPRLLLASVLGGALSLSGFLLQTFFRNPIAGPFVLGISSGAKMFLALVTTAFSAWMPAVPVAVTVAAAFLGSMLSMMFALLFSGRIKNMSMLLVIGIMISYICSAVTDFLINFAKEADIVNLTHWSMGSFSAASWQDVKLSTLIVLPTLLFVFLLSKPISAYALGEGYAQSLGVNVKRFRVLLILLSSIPFYRGLQKAGISFSAGILFENDVDYAVASALACQVVKCGAFSAITEEQLAAAMAAIDAAEAVVDPGCPVGEFNRANGELITYARTCGKQLVTSLTELTEVRP